MVASGSISNAVNVDGSGDLTMGSSGDLTTVDASDRCFGNTDVDGTINVEGAATLQSTLSAPIYLHSQPSTVLVLLNLTQQ